MYDTIIVGAGAAGLTAGYEFKRFGQNFVILEASDVWGGRVDGVNDLADFPLDIGGSWIHENGEGDENRDALDSIVRDSAKPVTVQTVPDDMSYSFYAEGVWVKNDTAQVDELFIGSSWYEFFNTYIAPSVLDDIVYNCPVSLIDYSEEDTVSLQCGNQVFQARNVIVTASIEVLRTGGITFNPIMPESQMAALDKSGWVVPIKGFIKFTEKFYAEQESFFIYTETFPFVGDDTYLLFWDASFMENSSDIVLGFLLVDEYTDVFDNLSEEESISTVLQHLDSAYNGKANSTYESSVIKNWAKEPYILGGWSSVSTNIVEYVNDLETLLTPLGDDQVYLAGEALPYDGWGSTVPAAALSGQYAACRILGGQVMNPGCVFPALPEATPAPMTTDTVAPVTGAPATIPDPGTTAAPVTSAPITTPATGSPIMETPTTVAPAGTSTSAPTAAPTAASTAFLAPLSIFLVVATSIFGLSL